MSTIALRALVALASLAAIAPAQKPKVLGKALRGHPAGIQSICFSPDGKRILSAGAAGELRLWSASSGKQTKKIRAHKGGVHVARFYDDGAKIVSIGDDRTVAFFDAKNGKELGRIKDLPEDFAEGDSYGTYAVTPDNAWLLIRDPRRKQKALLRVDLQKRVMAEPMPLPGNAITRLALSPDGRFLAMAERGDMFETYLHLYDLTEKKTVSRDKITYPNCMCFSPDGTKLFVLDHEAWYIYDGRTGKSDTSFESLVDTPRAAAANTDGSQLFVGSSIEGALVGVDLTAPKILFQYGEFATEVLGVALSPDQKTLVASSLDGTLRFFDPKTGKEKKKAKGLQSRITAVAMSADGTRVIAGTYDNEVAIWDVEKKKILARHREHEFFIMRVGFNANGQPWSVGQDMLLKLHDSKTGKVTKTVDLREHDKSLMDVAPTPDGKQLVASHYVETEDDVTGKQLYWDLLTGKLDKTVETDEVFNVQDITSAGKMVVVQGDRMALWSLQGTEPEFVFDKQEMGYYGMAILDDDHAVTSNLDDELLIYKRGETAPHKKVTHGAGITMAGLHASKDGNRIFFAGSEAIVIYDRELKELGRITKLDGYPISIALNADETKLICGMSDSTIKTWTLAKLLKK